LCATLVLVVVVVVHHFANRNSGGNAYKQLKEHIKKIVYSRLALLNTFLRIKGFGRNEKYIIKIKSILLSTGKKS